MFKYMYYIIKTFYASSEGNSGVGSHCSKTILSSNNILISVVFCKSFSNKKKMHMYRNIIVKPRI